MQPSRKPCQRMQPEECRPLPTDRFSGAHGLALLEDRIYGLCSAYGKPWCAAQTVSRSSRFDLAGKTARLQLALLRLFPSRQAPHRLYRTGLTTGASHLCPALPGVHRRLVAVGKFGSTRPAARFASRLAGMESTEEAASQAQATKVAWGTPSKEQNTPADSVLAWCQVASTDKEGLVRSRRENGRFVNPWPDSQPRSKTKMLKFLMGGNDQSQIPCCKQELEKTLPILRPDFDLLNSPVTSGIRITWIGHATVLVQMDNLTILTDPIFSQRSAMVQWAGPKRYRKVPCKIEELPKIDAVVISHTHYDHLDYNSVKSLNRRFGADLAWFVPLGHESWMADAGCQQVYGLDWWQEQTINKTSGMKFVFTPTKHWSQRSLTDTNKCLWGGWCILGSQRFYFAGDTAYCEVFKQIGKKYGPFNLAAIPIGAYDPRDMMWRVHVNPEEAVEMHKDVKARKSLGIHWGTFKLTQEFYLEPPQRLQAAMADQGLNSEDFFVLKHGETRQLQEEKHGEPEEFQD